MKKRLPNLLKKNNKQWCIVLMISLMVIINSSIANDQLPQWFTEGPKLKSSIASFEIPIEVFATKIYIHVEMAGKKRRFVVDTGSPSMIDQSLVDELGLQTVGSNKGQDAHGNIITSNIVQADLMIGDVAIDKLPMMTADFSSSVVTQSFIGDGVLGSDVLPLGVWQFDLKNSVLRFSTDVSALPNIEKTKKLKLYQFGYPYMPIFDVKFAKKARSKALFDTGSPTFFAISLADFNGAKKEKAVTKIIKGFGSPGSSLGGQAANIELFQAQLKKLEIDNIKLGRLMAQGRELSPSLIGARILEKFIVTFDSKTQTAYFKEYSKTPLTVSSFGFNLAFDGNISIGAVWEGSPADAADLKVGTELTAINGQPVAYSEQGLKMALSAMTGERIELSWKDGTVILSKTDE